MIEDKKWRHDYMIKRLRMLIAFQVRLIRLQRGWTQGQLAEQCHTEQPAIARVEDWDKPFPTVDTLKRIAEAFDCALQIGFVGWEDVINSLVQTGEDEFGKSEVSP